MNENWSKEEIFASVAAYLEMLSFLNAGQKVVKNKYYRDLSERFGRSEKAYEYRMQNISWVLSASGRNFIPGLLPAKHVGPNVASEIEACLASLEKREPNTNLDLECHFQTKLDKGKQAKPNGNKTPKTIKTSTTTYERDPCVKFWVYENAGGKCENCESKAPFVAYHGFPFLEVHHVRHLADGGSDTIENAVALCPNCHREFHYGKDRMLRIERLYSKISRLSRE